MRPDHTREQVDRIVTDGVRAGLGWEDVAAQLADRGLVIDRDDIRTAVLARRRLPKAALARIGRVA